MCKKIVLFTTIVLFFTSCEKDENPSEKLENVEEGTVVENVLTDLDGNTYSAVKIGDQIWMAENLAVSASHVTNGVDGDTATANSGLTDAYVWSNTFDSLGFLYSYQAALGACPTGWHLPSDDEWKTLEMHLGMSQSEAYKTGFRGIDEGNKLKSTSGWNRNGNGTDDYGFAALPGGICQYDGARHSQGDVGCWWSSTPRDHRSAYVRFLFYDYSNVYRHYGYCELGFSVRCVRD